MLVIVGCQERRQIPVDLASIQQNDSLQRIIAQRDNGSMT
jgi:hypothetical protein